MSGTIAVGQGGGKLVIPTHAAVVGDTSNDDSGCLLKGGCPTAVLLVHWVSPTYNCLQFSGPAE